MNYFIHATDVKNVHSVLLKPKIYNMSYNTHTYAYVDKLSFFIIRYNFMIIAIASI